MKKVVQSVAIATVVSGLMLLGYHLLNKKTKLAYVKSGEVLQNCKELKVGEEQYQKEIKVVKANLDTLANRYKRLELQYKMLNESDGKQILAELESAKENYQKYNVQASREMEARKQEISGKILERINKIIQDFGKNNGYEIIFGATTEGSILYGREADDLTEEITKLVNEK